MKIFKLPQLADSTPEGEYLLGQEELNTSGAYIRYSRLRPNETGKAIALREGYEEIVYVVKGKLSVRVGKSSFPISAGEAFVPDGKLIFDNLCAEEAVLIVAGGRPSATVPGAVKGETAAPEAHAEPKTEHKSTAHHQKEAAAEGPKDDDFEITAEDAPGEGEGQG